MISLVIEGAMAGATCLNIFGLIPSGPLALDGSRDLMMSVTSCIDVGIHVCVNVSSVSGSKGGS